MVNDSQLTVAVPAGAAAGPVGVTVTTAGGTNNGLSYTYVDVPTIGTLSPTSGPASGGTAVTITGTNLSTTQSVTFGATPAPFSVINDTTLSAVTPPAPDGCPVPPMSPSPPAAAATPRPTASPTWPVPASDRHPEPPTAWSADQARGQPARTGPPLPARALPHLP